MTTSVIRNSWPCAKPTGEASRSPRRASLLQSPSGRVKLLPPQASSLKPQPNNHPAGGHDRIRSLRIRPRGRSPHDTDAESGQRQQQRLCKRGIGNHPNQQSGSHHPPHDQCEHLHGLVEHDRGGETFSGIARKFHPHWEGWELVDKGDIKSSAVKQMVHNFYYFNF